MFNAVAIWGEREREREKERERERERLFRFKEAQSDCARQNHDEKTTPFTQFCLLTLVSQEPSSRGEQHWLRKKAKHMSDWYLMLHTLPISIQPAVNWPTVKHAGPANPCHTWRCWPQIKTHLTILSLPLLTPTTLHSSEHFCCKWFFTSPSRRFSPPCFQTPASHSPSHRSNLTLGWATALDCLPNGQS